MEEETVDQKESILTQILKLKEYDSVKLSSLSKEDAKTLKAEIQSWQQNFINTRINGRDAALQHFEIMARHAVISEKLRIILLQREEELLSSINDAQKDLNEWKSQTENLAPRDIQKKFTNEQIMDISRLRNQIVPGLFMELETLITAIKENEEINENSKEYIVCEIDSITIKALDQFIDE